MSGWPQPEVMQLSAAPDANDGHRGGSHPAPMLVTQRRRGRPPLQKPDEVLAEIRSAFAAGTLFRVHLDRPALYARARRLWGSWSAALAAAGLEPGAVLGAARQRALETRRRKRGESAR